MAADSSFSQREGAVFSKPDLLITLGAKVLHERVSGTGGYNETQHTEPQHRKPGLSEEKNIRMVTNRVFRVAR